jgi:peptidyl-tRNA hydrolase
MRSDILETMGIGKTCAQACHASLGSLLDYKDKFPNLANDASVVSWFSGKFVKIVVYVKSKEKLLNIAKKLELDSIKHKLIYDACRTKLEPEETDGTTLTCLGVIPLFQDEVPKYLKSLQLLEG